MSAANFIDKLSQAQESCYIFPLSSEDAVKERGTTVVEVVARSTKLNPESSVINGVCSIESSPTR
jgi:hypothetical protein